MVLLKCGDFDKYGRLLADVYLPGFLGKSLSQILVEEKLAFVYDGGKKYLEDEQLNILKK